MWVKRMRAGLPPRTVLRSAGGSASWPNPTVFSYQLPSCSITGSAPSGVGNELIRRSIVVVLGAEPVVDSHGVGERARHRAVLALLEQVLAGQPEVVTANRNDMQRGAEGVGQGQPGPEAEPSPSDGGSPEAQRW